MESSTVYVSFIILKKAGTYHLSTWKSAEPTGLTLTQSVSGSTAETPWTVRDGMGVTDPSAKECHHRSARMAHGDLSI